MKEVMCIICLNKVNKIKEVFVEVGFLLIICRKVFGRGKKFIDKVLVEVYIEVGDILLLLYGENLLERGRLIFKRFIILMVKDDEVKNVVDIIISINLIGILGDGKIFILLIEEVYRVRDG